MSKLNSFTKKAVLGLSALSLLGATQPTQAGLGRQLTTGVAVLMGLNAAWSVARMFRICPKIFGPGDEREDIVFHLSSADEINVVFWGSLALATYAISRRL